MRRCGGTGETVQCRRDDRTSGRLDVNGLVTLSGRAERPVLARLERGETIRRDVEATAADHRGELISLSVTAAGRQKPRAARSSHTASTS